MSHRRGRRRRGEEPLFLRLLLTESMYRTEAHQTDCVILHVVVPAPVPLPGQLGASPQAADDEQRQHGEAKDTGDDGDDNGLGGN